MKIIVLGASGMLGQALSRELAGGNEACGRTRADYDIRDHQAFARDLSETGPEVVINSAAYTRVDDAEDEVELAMEINGHAPGRLAAACQKAGVAFVQISTDYVFSGEGSRPWREDDPTGPLSAYGKSKLLGEHEVTASCPENKLIVRSSGLFGEGGRNFVKTMAERYRSGQSQFRVVNDQTGSPTYTGDLARAIMALLEKKCRGIYHASNSGSVTWYDFAREIFQKIGANDARVEPVTSDDFAARARRPSYSVLDSGKLKRDTGLAMPPYSDALVRYLEKEFGVDRLSGR